MTFGASRPTAMQPVQRFLFMRVDSLDILFNMCCLIVFTLVI